MPSPPETYQQWLTCFQHLQQHPLDHATLDALSKGSYLGQPAESFLVRLSNTVGEVITSHCRRFLRQIDEAFADGEPDMVVLFASRLRKNIRKCFFYRSLSFLEMSYIQTLDRGFCEQLDFFWKNFLNELQKTARDSTDGRIEDLYFKMKRMKLL